MDVPVNISNDFSAGALTHNVLNPPAIPSPTPMPSVEMIATQFWPPGFALNQNKLTTKVLHKTMSIVQFGHDCGAMVLDITPPMMANYYYAIMWPFSSRKIVFPSSTVLMQGTATGVAMYPITPMMTCGDPVSAPLAQVIPLQLLNTVKVGFSFTDFLVGLAQIAVSMAIDFAFEYAFKGFSFRGAASEWAEAFTRTAEDVAFGPGERIAKQLGSELLGKVAFKDARGLLKRVVSSAANFGLSTVEPGNPTVQFGLGAPFAGGQVGYQFGGGKGSGFQDQGTVGPRQWNNQNHGNWMGRQLP